MKTRARSYFEAIENPMDTGLRFDDPSLTVQAPKDDVDINNIINKYLRTGELPAVRQGVYADISGLVGLRESVEQVMFAREAFMLLPAKVRQYFDNDPVKLVEFAEDSRNYEKAVELGLALPRQPVLPSGVHYVNAVNSAPVQGASAGTEPAPQS